MSKGEKLNSCTANELISLSSNFNIANNSEAFDFHKTIITQWGAEITPNENRWFLQEHFIDFDDLIVYASRNFINRLKIVLAYRSMKLSYHTILNDYYRTRDLLKFLNSRGINNIEVFTEENLIWWRAILKSADREYNLGAIKSVLLDSEIYLDICLVESSALSYLKGATVSGNPKGIRVNDRDMGRLTLAEREIFETRARQCFERRVIDSQEFLALILMNSYGLRTIDLASLKVLDIKIKYLNGEISESTIDIPICKSGESPRSKMSYGNRIESEVALLFKSHIKGVPPNYPLFNDKNSCAARQTGILENHLSPGTISWYLQRSINKMELDFNLNSYRFRYTVGTEAFRETGNPYVAAAILRHSDIQNVKVYANEIILAQAHDRVVNQVFSDINSVFEAAVKAKTFSGILISRQNYNDENVIAVRAMKQIGNFTPIGGCTGELGCAQGMPVACYCCRKFRPIRESDHFGMLCSTLNSYFETVIFDEKLATSLVSSILGMAQVCHLTGQGRDHLKEGM